MLRAIDLCLAHGSDLLVEDACLTVAPGDRIGLVGPNGAGKSTLLAALAGRLHPLSGRVERGPGTRIGLLEQATPPGERTVAEHLRRAAPHLHDAHAALLAAASSADEPDGIERYAAALARFEREGGWAALVEADALRSRLGVGTEGGIDADRPLRTLSGGERARVLLAATLLQGPDVLLLDEPTNHLDAEGSAWLVEFLRGFRGGVLVSSHDRRFLDETVDRVVELGALEPGLVDYPGCGWSSYRVERARRMERLLLDVAAQEKYRAQLEASIAAMEERSREGEAGNPRNPAARRKARMQAKKMVARRARLRREMARASWAVRPEERPPLQVRVPSPPESDEAVLDAVVSASAGGQALVAPVRLTIASGDRVLLTGRNGCGKSTLLAAVRPHLRGAVGVLGQEDTFDLDLTVREAFRAVVPMWADEAEAVLEAWLFEPETWGRRVGSLSGGERRRLALAALLQEPASVLVLDEPTNHLDVESMEVVEEAFARWAGTLLLVTHDREHAQRLGVSRRWELRDGRLSELPPTAGAE